MSGGRGDPPAGAAPAGSTARALAAAWSASVMNGTPPQYHLVKSMWLSTWKAAVSEYIVIRVFDWRSGKT